MIRLYNPSDYYKVLDIHHKYYESEFPFPIDTNRMISNHFVVTDDDSKIITYGAIEWTAELLAVTDKNRSKREIYKASFDLLTAASQMVKGYNVNMLHVSVQDETWERNLKKAGFEDSKGKHLFLKLW